MSKNTKAKLPKYRFPEFTTADEWSVTTLGAISDPIRKRAGSNKYTLMSVTAGVGLIPQTEKFGREIAGSSYKNYIVIRQGDFAYNKSATKLFPEGYIAMLTNYDEAALPNSIFTCFRITDEQVCDEFINHIFQSNYHGAWLRKFIAAGARSHGSLNIDDKHLWDMPVALPELPEQQAIAGCLTSLEELIAAESKKLVALKTHKKGLMQKLFPSEGKTVPEWRFPEFRDSGEWKKKTLAQVTTSISNGLSLEQTDNCIGYAVTRIETISDQTINLSRIGYIQTEQDISSYKLNKGDILLSNINSLRHIGKVAIIDKDYNLYHGMNLLRLQVALKLNSPKFIFYLLDTETLKFSFKSRANQAINQASINQTEIGRTPIIIPSVITEQQKIADCLSALDELLTAQTKKIETLKLHKKGLMQGLFPSEQEVIE